MKTDSTVLNDFIKCSEKNLSISQKRVFTCQLIWLFIFAGNAQQYEKRYNWIEFGYSPLVCNSALLISFQNIVEMDYCKRFSGNVYVKTGARLSTDPLIPEGFIQLTVSIFDRIWHPEIGVELGYAGGTNSDEIKKLSGRTNNTLDRYVSPLFFAVEAKPFAFQIFKSWEVSFCELRTDTHFIFPGQMVNVQLGILSIGKFL